MRLRSWRKLHYSLLSCNNECSVSTIPFNRKPIASLENLRKKFRKIELDPLLNGFCLFLSRNIDEIDEIQWRWNYVNVKWDSHSSTSAQPLNWSNKAQLNVEYLRQNGLSGSLTQWLQSHYHKELAKHKHGNNIKELALPFVHHVSNTKIQIYENTNIRKPFDVLYVACG